MVITAVHVDGYRGVITAPLSVVSPVASFAAVCLAISVRTSSCSFLLNSRGQGTQTRILSGVSPASGERHINNVLERGQGALV